MNVTNIQSIVAPMLAPIAPAVLFGNNLHAGMIADGVQPTLALAAAVLGTGGVEIAGALACSMAVMAYHKRDTKIMWVSIVAAGIYAVFVMIGIMQARNTATFAGAVVISLVAYLMQGVWQSYNNKLRVEQAEADLKIKALEAERKLQNSRNRGLKLSNGTNSENIGKISENSDDKRMRWNEVNRDDYEWIARARTSEIVNKYGIDERTARNWREHARE